MGLDSSFCCIVTGIAEVQGNSIDYDYFVVVMYVNWIGNVS